MTPGSAMVTQRWLFIDQGSTNVPPTSPSTRLTEPSPGTKFNMTGDNIEVKITCQYFLQSQTITSLKTGDDLFLIMEDFSTTEYKASASTVQQTHMYAHM